MKLILVRAIVQLEELAKAARELCKEQEKLEQMQLLGTKLLNQGRNEASIQEALKKLNDKKFAESEGAEAFKKNQNYKEFALKFKVSFRHRHVLRLSLPNIRTKKSNQAAWHHVLLPWYCDSRLPRE